MNRNPPVMRRELSPSVRTSTYSSPIFRESQSATYQVPGSPLTINLSVRVGPDQTTGVSYRLLHTSSLLDKKASSKLEETVIRLKEKQDDALAQISKVEDLEKKIASVIEQDDMVRYKVVHSGINTDYNVLQAVKDKVEATKLEVQKRSLWEKVVAEAKHYYSGFKLLFLDVKLASQIIWKIAQGKTLSRRENRQLVRTVSDLFRLVPFSVFILVPFMELLLPVALKLFPGMLPSTFTSQDERENKMRR